MYTPNSSVYQYGQATNPYPVEWYNPPHGYPSGRYIVRRYEMRADVIYGPHWGTPDVWVRIGGTTGFGLENPHYGCITWGDVVSMSPTGCTLRTYTYEVSTYPNGSPVGWWPARPEDVGIAYTWTCRSFASPVEEMSDISHPLDIHLDPNPQRLGNVHGLVLCIPRTGMTEVGVFDVAGRRLTSVYSGILEAGQHSIQWDGRVRDGTAIPAGTYFLEARFRDGGRSTKKLVLVP
jgi:hypothetical protein